MPESALLPASPLHALSVYAEPLVAGRRVVVFADRASGLGERLLDMGARSVHLYDPRPLRAGAPAEKAPRGLVVQSLPSGDFDVRDGAFDVAIITDLGAIPTPAALLQRLRKLLATGGAALVRSRNPEASLKDTRPGQASPDYYELYDLVAMQFAHVRMIGQIPWTGALLCELGREGDEPDVTVDTQLALEESTPDAFIALCSQDDVRLAEYALIQLPPVLPDEMDDTVSPGSERADLAAAQLRASLLEAQVEELRLQRNVDGAATADAVATLEGELAFRLTELQGAEGRAVEAQTRSERIAAELRAREEELARAKERASHATREVDEERSQRSRVERDLVASRRSVEVAAVSAQGLEAAQARVALLEAALLEKGARASAATDRVALLEAEVAVLGEGLGTELVAFEEALRERARTVHALEQELARRERIVHDLVHALEEARAGESEGPSEHESSRASEAAAEAEAQVRRAARQLEQLRAENADLRQKLDAAALEIARREAESTTSTWRIQELEQEVSRLDVEQSESTLTIPPPAFVSLEREANDATRLAARLATAEDELDVLRQALAQEHAARARAESGETLEQARAELARQAVLLEKLSRELEAHDGVRRVEGTPAGDASAEVV